MKVLPITLVCVIVASLHLHAKTYESAIGKEGIKTVVEEVTKAYIKDFEMSQSAQITRARVLDITAEFQPEVMKRIARTNTSLDRKAAEVKLRFGFLLFLRNFTKYLEKDMGQYTLKMNKSNLESYLKDKQKGGKCGEIPCSQPPCCEDCDPCSKRGVQIGVAQQSESESLGACRD